MAFAAAVRDMGDDPKIYVTNANEASIHVTNMEDWIDVLLRYDFVDEARRLAVNIVEGGSDNEYTVGILWAHIGQWYADHALAKEKSSETVLKRVEAPV